MKIKINEYIYYSYYGICKVEDLKNIKLGDEEKEYFVLSSYKNNQTIFLPKDNINSDKVKKILPKKEIDNIIKSAKEKIIIWPKKAKERNVYLIESLKKDDLSITIAILLKIIYKQNNNEPLSPNDLMIYGNIKKLICECLSFSLNIDEDEVVEYIINN